MKDEKDYIKEDRQDLVARLMASQALSQFLIRAYHALRSYSVDAMSLPEWKDTKPLEDAAKLKPHAAQGKLMAYFQRLENALSAAIRRKQFKLTVFKPQPSGDGSKKDTDKPDS